MFRGSRRSRSDPASENVLSFRRGNRPKHDVLGKQFGELDHHGCSPRICANSRDREVR
jgi:hypothetical protein